MFSFPPKKRLHTSRDYAAVWRDGRKYHTPHLIVIVAPGSSPDIRLGMTVSRKVGNAVCRNQIKRWIREFFRHRSWDSLPPVDINIVVKRHAGSIAHDELDQELSSAFLRLEADGCL
jgi:ribonuclease P protein component